MLYSKATKLGYRTPALFDEEEWAYSSDGWAMRSCPMQLNLRENHLESEQR